MTRTGIRWFCQELKCCCLIFQILLLVAWTPHLWKMASQLQKAKRMLWYHEFGCACSRKRKEFGVVVEWTFQLTSNLRNNAGCVWKEKSPNRLPVHRSYRTKFERLVLVQENQDVLPDCWACNIGLCIEFCDLVRCVKVTNTHRARQAG